MSCAVWIPGYGTLTPSAGWSERGSWSSRIVGQLLVAGSMGWLRCLPGRCAGVSLTAQDALRTELAPHPEWVAHTPGGPVSGVPGAGVACQSETGGIFTASIPRVAPE